MSPNGTLQKLDKMVKRLDKYNKIVTKDPNKFFDENVGPVSINLLIDIYLAGSKLKKQLQNRDFPLKITAISFFNE